MEFDTKLVSVNSFNIAHFSVHGHTHSVKQYSKLQMKRIFNLLDENLITSLGHGFCTEYEPTSWLIRTSRNSKHCLCHSAHVSEDVSFPFNHSVININCLYFSIRYSLCEVDHVVHRTGLCSNGCWVLLTRRGFYGDSSCGTDALLDVVPGPSVADSCSEDHFELGTDRVESDCHCSDWNFGERHSYVLILYLFYLSINWFL